MNTIPKVQQSNITKSSEEKEFFERRPLLIYEDNFLWYSQGFCNQRFTRKQLEYLKNKIEKTLNFYDENSTTDLLIKDINNEEHYSRLAKANEVPSIKKIKKVRQGYIYLIQNSVNNSLKVGFSKNPQSRLQQLNTASSEPLRMICHKKGTLDEEKSIHQELIGIKLNTEWYPNSNEVYKFF